MKGKPYTISFFYSLACNCNEIGALNTTCNQTSGQCFCKENIVGRSCNRKYWKLKKYTMTIILLSNSDVKKTTGTLLVEMDAVFVIVTKMDQLTDNVMRWLVNANVKKMFTAKGLLIVKVISIKVT